jgi:hypothetical protein
MIQRTDSELAVKRLSDIQALQKEAAFERYFLGRIREKVKTSEGTILDSGSDWEQTQRERARRSAFLEILKMAEQDKAYYLERLSEAEKEEEG